MYSASLSVSVPAALLASVPSGFFASANQSPDQSSYARIRKPLEYHLLHCCSPFVA